MSQLWKCNCQMLSYNNSFPVAALLTCFVSLVITFDLFHSFTQDITMQPTMTRLINLREM